MTTRLEIILAAQNQISGELKSVKKELTGLENSTAKTNKEVTKMGTGLDKAKGAASGLLNVLVALGAIRLFTDAVKTIGQFEQSMAQVAAVTGATGKELQSLSDEARRLGATTVFSASQAADGLEFLGRAGFNTNESLKALEGTLNLAAAGGLELGAAADIASNILSGFGESADQASRVADVLAKTAASSNTNVEQLGYAMAYVAPVAAAMGLSVETASAAVGKLSDAGLQGSTAGTGLRKVLSVLNTPTAKLTRTLDKLGLETKDVAVTGENLSEVMGILGARGLSATDALQLFGDRGAPAALAMANVSAEMAVLNQELNAAEGSATEMADIMSDTLFGAFKQLKSAIEETVLATGDSGLSANLREIVDVMGGVVRTLNGTQDPLDENAEKFRYWSNVIESAKYILGAFLAIKVGGLFVTLASGISASVVAFRTATAAAGGFSAALTGLGRVAAIALGPIGWLVGIGLTLYSLATNDAPIATAALADFEKELVKTKNTAEGLSRAGLSESFEQTYSTVKALEKELVRVRKGIEDNEYDSVFGISIGDKAELEQREKDVIAALNKQRKLLDVFQVENDKRESETTSAFEKQLKDRAKLRLDVTQSALSAAQAEDKLERDKAAQQLKFEKETAIQRAIIRKAELTEALNNEQITIGEYYLQLEMMEEENQTATKKILDQKLVDLRANLDDQIEAEQAARDRRIDQTGTGADSAEAELITQASNSRLSAITSAYEAERNEVLLQKDKLAVALSVKSSELNAQEIDAIKKAADDELKAEEERITAQGDIFQRELDQILAHRDAKIAASETDTQGDFTDTARLQALSEANDQANLEIEALQQRVIDFNMSVQDPNNKVAVAGLAEAYNTTAEQISPIMDQLEGRLPSLASGLVSSMEAFGRSTEEGKNAFKEFAKQFLVDIARMIIQQQVLNALKVAFGFSGGGAVDGGGKASKGGYFESGPAKGYATGGFITGKGTSTSDSIPARLSHGEYVIQAKSVDHYGLNFMEAINRMALNTKGTPLPKFQITRPRKAFFAEGGAVNGQSANAQGAKPEVKVRVVNNVDPDLVEGYMNSRMGEETILNLISNNTDKINGVLGR